VSVSSGVTAPPPGGLPDREFSGEFLRLHALALNWIGPYYDGVHLRRASEWLTALDPHAAEPLIIAVLTHDMERSAAGGPVLDKQHVPWDDVDYNRRHCERSADVVAGWLREHHAPAEFIEGVRVPILEHEFGGSREGDLAQAADSLSWLEVNAPLASDWALRGDCSAEKAAEKLRWMLDRIRLPPAAEIARPLYGQAMAEFDAAVRGQADRT
jgi:hypothetical protein